ncbi:unnamed protein product [Agarophyton chilense]
MRKLRNPIFQNKLHSDIVSSQCAVVKDGVLYQKAVNVTKDRGEVLVHCSKDYIFSFRLSDYVTERKFPDIKPTMGCSSCSKIPEPENCPTFCAFVVVQNNSVFYSGATSEKWALEKGSSGQAQKELTFLGTDVYFRAENLQREMAERAAQAFADSSTHPLSQRRRILMGSGERSCEFSVGEREGTDVPIAILVSLTGIWMSSLFLGGASFVLRRRNSFDISDPLEWAFRSIEKPGAPIETDPAITVQCMDEKKYFLLSEAV